jgi:uncharacterized protein YodC (DUF2158 family)
VKGGGVDVIEFKKGDRVQLKSGGPIMIVVSVGNYAGGFGPDPMGGVQCDWYEGRDPFTRIFESTALRLHEPCEPPRDETTPKPH